MSSGQRHSIGGRPYHSSSQHSSGRPHDTSLPNQQVVYNIGTNI